MARTKIIVAPEPGSKRSWTVGASGPSEPVATTRTQAEAIALAREELARLGGGELEIRGRDGRVREARTLGAKENRRSPG